MGFGQSMKRWANGKQHVSQIFNPNPSLARLAIEALEWSLADRGLKLTEDIVAEARAEVDKYPFLTVKEFVEGRYNRNLQESLRPF